MRSRERAHQKSFHLLSINEDSIFLLYMQQEVVTQLPSVLGHFLLETEISGALIAKITKQAEFTCLLIFTRNLFS